MQGLILPAPGAQPLRRRLGWKSTGVIHRNIITKAMLDIMQNCAPRDLLMARTSAGMDEIFEVKQTSGSSVVVGWKGQLLKLQQGVSEPQAYLEVQNIGHYPEPTSILCQKLPQFQAHLQACQEHAGSVNWRIADLSALTSLEQLTQSVAKDPSLWCDGTKPGAPSNSPLAAATLTAGMLLALVGGRRGIATVQLWNGWDKARGQPLYDPLALHVLEMALAVPGVSCLPSSAPGGVGLTAIVYVDREPWNAWAKHLASFGMQANIVAGSPFYKLLIGRILGYKEEYVRGYVAATSPPGALTTALIADVESEMRKLSKVKPKLPWNAAGGSRGKKGAVKAEAGKVAVGFGSAKGR